jgi:hypothetical protein
MTESEWQARLDDLLANYDSRYDPLHNVELFEKLVTESTPIGTWPEFEDWSLPFRDTGCFRGQADATWHLTTTSERRTWQEWAMEINSTTMESVANVMPEENEEAVLQDFQREAHHYYPSTPFDQTVDWLALLQHHGGPTRMLDWSRSPYVALYFAMRRNPASDATLWAINLKWLRECSTELLRHQDTDCPDDSDQLSRYINRILLRRGNPQIIVCASPVQLNERMRIQQGELLCNLQQGGSGFSAILLGMLIHSSKARQQVVSRIVVRKHLKSEFLERLRRMNTDETSLLPGADFAKPLDAFLETRVRQQVEDRKQAYREYVLSKR